MVDAWWYALIPAFIGILIAACGWISLKNTRAQTFATPLVFLLSILVCSGLILLLKLKGAR